MNREDVRTGQTVRINNHRGHTRDICGATGTVVNYDHNPASYSLKVDLGEFGVRWFHHSDLTWVADPPPTPLETALALLAEAVTMEHDDDWDWHTRTRTFLKEQK